MPFSIESAPMPGIERAEFGRDTTGRPVERYTLRGAGGMQLRVLTRGAAIQSLRVPDRTGALDDVVLGYDDLAAYEADRYYLGAVVGRYAGRIRRGAFPLDGETVRVTLNAGRHHLHGGSRGFDRVVWDAESLLLGADPALRLSYLSADGEEGYPGNLEVEVVYRVTASNELVVRYGARSDRPTAVNLTQHTYLNLGGAGRGDVLGHLVALRAGHYLPVDVDMIPTGTLCPVADTPFDFRAPTRLADHLNGYLRARDVDLPGTPAHRAREQLRYAGGFDHDFVLDATEQGTPAVRVLEPESGRVLEVHTTEPAVHLYTGNFLPESLHGRDGRTYRRRGGLCLETQHFADSPNRPEFPSTILRPGEVFESRTTWAFSVAG